MLAGMTKRQAKTFGQLLRAFREGKGWTPEQLAERAGLHWDTVRKLERGDRARVSVDVASKLADALGLTLDELVGRKPPETG